VHEDLAAFADWMLSRPVNTLQANNHKSK
jgi:hypothetical protein